MKCVRGLGRRLAFIVSMVSAGAAADDTPPSDPAKLQEWIKQKQVEGMAALAKAQVEMSRRAAAETKPVQRKDNEDDKEPVVQRPQRDVTRSARARQFAVTPAGLNHDLAGIAIDIAKALSPEARVEAMRIVEQFRTRGAVLANAAAAAWVQQAPEQALLLAAEAAKAAPNDPNCINTLGALLAQAGYEEVAIPLLKYLVEIYPNEPTILTNLGVAWLNLGEVQDAEVYLRRCVALAPGHGAAHAALGVIAEAAGQHTAATDHFQKAAASHSSPLARRILKSQKSAFRTPKGFFGMMPKQDYFSPSGYQPVAAQRTLAEYATKKAEKAAYDAALSKALAQQERAMMENVLEVMMSAVAPKNGVYAKLDWDNFSKSWNVEQEMERAVRLLAARQLSIRTLLLELGRVVPEYASGGTPENVPECERKAGAAQACLANLSHEYEMMQSETLFPWRNVTNQQLTYLRFMVPAVAYKSSFAAQVTAYLNIVRKLNEELPLLSNPCAKREDLRGQRDLEALGPRECPFSLEMEFVVVTLNMDCTHFGFDFKAGLAFSASKDFVSGETTLTAGVGAKTDLGSIGKASVSGQMVMVWDADNSLSFVGVEAVAGAKLSGIPGLSGVIDGNTGDLGAVGPSDGPSLTVSGADLTKDLVKVGSDTKLGVTIGPKGVEPSLTGDISGKLLGDKIFAVELK
jgi:Flp pilus assembly protein TadD